MARATIFELCRSEVSVSSELAKDPTSTPSSICKRLFGHHGEEASKDEEKESEASPTSGPNEALECGTWGRTKPSQLFLTIYNDVLHSLKGDPLGGRCSPSLLGSNGVCPLTVIATIPDVCRHMSNLIARAEHEVYLATNFWAISEGSKLISNAFRELSKRASEDGRQVVVKIIYDRGNAKQFLKNHQSVPAKTYSDQDGPIGLPSPEEIPNVNIEVVNYHRPALGTMHAKFMIVDRKIAIVQSNNIMDNDNMEMMAQYEGDIVNSIYDTALITWHNELDPPMPCIDLPASSATTPTTAAQSFQDLFNKKGEHTSYGHQTLKPAPEGNEHDLQRIATHASTLDLPRHTPSDPHYDADIAGEVLRAVATLNPLEDETRIHSISRLLNGPSPNNQEPSAPEITPPDTMTPLIPIPHHDPVPMAMVNRPPYGGVTNKSVHVPQNAAFTSALRNATRSIFIQTPDLNAEALLPEILSAARRGVHVTYYYCLGYNDAGELLPKQGGHNESIANYLYSDLEPEFHANLDIHAYVAKDQIHPIHNKFKKRSCHIKLMIVDGHIGIQGSGNQDTQSWYHSQEVNVMLDSELICSKWIDGIRQNQNTHLYGRVEKKGEFAGCWIDPQSGNMAEGAIGVDAGKFAWAKGVIGAVQRARGLGGF